MQKKYSFVIVSLIFITTIFSSLKLQAWEWSDLWRAFSPPEEKVEELDEATMLKVSEGVEVMSEEEFKVEYPGFEFDDEKRLSEEPAEILMIEERAQLPVIQERVELELEPTEEVEALSPAQIQLKNLSEQAPLLEKGELIPNLSLDELTEIAVQDIENDISKLKKERSYELIAQDKLVISAEQNVVRYGSGDSQIIFEREIVNGFGDNELIVEIKEYVMIDPYENADIENYYTPLGNGFEFKIHGVVHNPIHVTLTNPELTQVLTQVAEVIGEEVGAPVEGNVETNERDKVEERIELQEERIEKPESGMILEKFEGLLQKFGLLKTAYAQEFGRTPDDVDAPGERGVEMGSVPEVREFGIGVGGQDGKTKTPIPWGEGGKPKPKRNPNELKGFYKAMEESFPLIENNIGGVQYKKFPVPGQDLDFNRMGITFTIEPDTDHINEPSYDAVSLRGFVEGVGFGARGVGMKPEFMGRLFKTAKEWGHSAIQKTKNIFTATDYNCIELWYDGNWNYVGKRKRYALHNVFYKDNPIYEICGVSEGELASQAFEAKVIKNGIYDGGFYEAFYSALLRVFSYYTGLQLPKNSFPASNNGALNFPVPSLPISIKLSPHILIKDGKKIPRETGGYLATVSSSKYWIDFDSTWLYDAFKNSSSLPQTLATKPIKGDRQLISTPAHELMHFFDFQSLLRKGGFSAWQRLTSTTKEATATFSEEETSDGGLASWPFVQGKYLQGIISLNGIAHFKNKNQYTYHIRSPVIERGYLNSPYLRSIKYRDDYLKDVQGGKVEDIFEYIVNQRSKKNPIGSLDDMRGMEINRFFQNLLECKIYKQGGYDILGMPVVDTRDKYFDAFGDKFEEFETNTSQYDFYDWLKCRNYGIPGQEVVSAFRESKNNLSDITSLNLGAQSVYYDNTQWLWKPFCYDAEQLKKKIMYNVLRLDPGDKIYKVKIGSFNSALIPTLACLKPFDNSLKYELEGAEVDGKIKNELEPVLMYNMIPYSAMTGVLDFIDMRKVDSTKEASLRFDFYLQRPSGKEQLYLDYYAKNMFISVIVEYEQGPPLKMNIPLYALPFPKNRMTAKLAELDNQKKIVPGKTTDWFVKQLKLGMKKNTSGSSEGVIKRVTFMVVNGNGCKGLGIDLTKWCKGTVGNSINGQGQQATNIYFGMSATIVNEKPCEDGMARIPETGECGCKVTKNNTVVGKACDAGFKSKMIPDPDDSAGKKMCECVPKCSGLERWDDKLKVCEPCKEGEYNAWYDAEVESERTGMLSLCWDCKSLKQSTLKWSDLKTGKKCSPDDYYCGASCGCPDKFEKSDDEKTCQAPCDLGDRWDGSKEKCVACEWWQTSSDDRTKCVDCNPGNPSSDSMLRYPKYKYFFVGPGDRGCFLMKDKCNQYQAYSTKDRKCYACPQSGPVEKGHTAGGTWAVGRGGKGTDMAYIHLCACRTGEEVNVLSNCPTQCPKSMAWINQKCKSCSASERMARDRKSCLQCDPLGGIQNPKDPYSCICKSTHEPINMGTYIECREKCQPGLVRHGGVCLKPCPKGMIYKMGKCVKELSCSSGQVAYNGTCYWEAGYGTCSKVFLSDGRLLAQSTGCTGNEIYKCEYNKWNKHYCHSGYDYIESSQCSKYDHNHGGNLCCLKYPNVSVDYKSYYGGPTSSLNKYCCPPGMSPSKIGDKMICR
ncbi:MAG: hypothetical protein ABIE74_00930 [Pseudomonadota bacterium]